MVLPARISQHGLHHIKFLTKFINVSSVSYVLQTTDITVNDIQSKLLLSPMVCNNCLRKWYLDLSANLLILV